MPDTAQTELPLGRMFGYLTKQYIGFLSSRMKDTPVGRYYFPLYLIGKNSGRISQQQLANQLLMDKVSLVRVLDSLAEDGMIERKVNPGDRRQHLLQVTEKGTPWIREIERSLRETDQLFLELLPKASRETFHAQLQLLLNAAKDLAVEETELFYDKTNGLHHD